MPSFVVLETMDASEGWKASVVVFSFDFSLTLAYSLIWTILIAEIGHDLLLNLTRCKAWSVTFLFVFVSPDPAKKPFTFDNCMIEKNGLSVSDIWYLDSGAFTAIPILRYPTYDWCLNRKDFINYSLFLLVIDCRDHRIAFAFSTFATTEVGRSRGHHLSDWG